MVYPFDPQHHQLATVTNAGVFPVQVTTMPAISVSIAAVTVSNLASVPLTMSGTTIAITSIGTMPSVSVTTETNIISGVISVNNIVVQSTHWNATATYTSAQVGALVRANPGSNTALYITDIVASNENTAGNMRFIETSTSIGAVKVERLYFAANGGAVMNFATPIVLSTNTGLALISTTVTNHSVTIVGYTA